MSLITNEFLTLEVPMVVSLVAYTNGDVVGGLLELSDLTGGGGGGTIKKILVTDNIEQNAVFKLYIFDGKPTIIADNAAFATAMLIADLKKLVAVIDIATYVSLNSLSYSLVAGQDHSHGKGELWGYLVVNDGTPPTYLAVDDLSLKITGEVI